MLSNLKVHKDEKGFYLSAEYTYDDKYSTRKLSIPKIRLNDVLQEPCFHATSDVTYIDIGFGECRLEPDSNGRCYTMTTLKEKPQEITLSEIEKRLGYKVKIVSE
jgi:hypothetical protein